MIKTIKSDKADYLVKKVINNENLLGLNPIIAGGSMLAVYRAIVMHDTDDKWAYFKRTIEWSPKTSGVSAFVDIDIWFEDGHDIYDESNAYSFLVSCGEPGEERSGGWIHTLCNNCWENWDEIRAKRWSE